MEKQGKDMEKLQKVISTLLDGKSLDKKYRDHPLGGSWKGHRECHVEPDWLLIYYKNKSTIVLTAIRTGSHQELFCE